MYKGNNPTAIKSQKWLVESLIKLLKRKRFSDITISNICLEADLSRQTFYNFFESKEEIIRFYIHRLYEEKFSTFISIPTMEATVDAIATILSENEKVFNLLIDNKLESLIVQEVADCISLFANKYLEEKYLEDKRFIYQIVLLSGALAQLLVFWIKQEDPISKEELVCLLIDFFSGNVYEFKNHSIIR